MATKDKTKAKPKTKAKSKSKTKAKKPSIPALGVGNDLSEALEAFAVDMNIGGVKKKGTTERWSMELDEEAENALREFVPVKQVFDQAESEKKLKAADAKEALWPLFISAMWERKSKPDNPHVFAHDYVKGENGEYVIEDGKKIPCVTYSGLFMVVEKWENIVIPPLEPGQPLKPTMIGFLAEELVIEDEENPLTPEQAVDIAEKIVENELILTPKITIDLTKQIHGYKANKKWVPGSGPSRDAAMALFVAKQAGEGVELPADLMQALEFTVAPDAFAKPGFLERAVGYIESEKQLSALLSVICPQYYASRVKIDTDEDKNTKDDVLIKKYKDIIGYKD
ncbi:MAG: hypothetical protein ACW99G_02625 [Candidatus Thorarchaeota archaeon]|jgi:hypothetical protein